MDIDPSFGHWLAGFVAGEGCFLVSKQRNTWNCIFTLSLRDDDAEILWEIHDRLGIGRLQKKPEKGSSKPQTEWIVSNKEDCLQLVYILDKFSLRAKKARDFHIWRRAVFAHSAKDVERVASLAVELKQTRAYKSPSTRR